MNSDPLLTPVPATGVEGIFRLNGSEKRIKELKTIFDSPDRYGKGLIWDGYTVHDAATVLRRYLNDLPEPVVPLDLYEKFRDPLRGATKQAVGDTDGPQFVENFDERAAIFKYQKVITDLPPLNKQLLLYILDLLAVFAAKSDENRMNSQNLAAIFQPGMLSHPSHAMAPEEYRLNQCVIIFLIENQDHFLIGMQGTEADETMRQQVASGPSNGPRTPNPDRSSGLGRTASNASAGAENVRKDGMIRRNRSVSSRHSRVDGAATPNSPALAATPTGGGLARSNTVPSKKSPALVGGKFKKNESPGRAPHSPALEALTPAHPPSETPNRVSTPNPSQTTFDSMHLSPDRLLSPGRSQERLLDAPHEHSTPAKHQNIQKLEHLFQRSPNHESSDKRQPNKLKKKRIPGSMSISAQSSVTSLPHSASPGTEAGNPLEAAPVFAQPIAQPQFRPSTIPHSVPQPAPFASAPSVESQKQPDLHHQHSTPVIHQNHADYHNHAISHYHEHNLRSEDIPRGKKSPPASVGSSFNDGSDFEQVAHEVPLPAIVETTDKEKKSRWRLSRTKRDDFASGPTSPRTSPPQFNIGSNNNADVSTTSIGSAIAMPRKSFTGESSEHLGSGSDRAYTYESSRDDKDDPKGPLGWIKHKYREAKENVDHKRTKSPPPPDHHHHAFSPSLLASRGKSLDIKRDLSREEENLFTKPVQQDVFRDSQKDKINVIPQAPDTYKKLGQTEAVQREPAQGMTIHRVISDTEKAPAKPVPQSAAPAATVTKEEAPETTTQPKTQTPSAPQSETEPPVEPPLPSVVENKEQEEKQA